MYIYYKDKNNTISFIELKNKGDSFRFEYPVFIFHLHYGDGYKFYIRNLNPYEIAYTSNSLKFEFEIQDHMYTMKTIRLES